MSEKKKLIPKRRFKEFENTDAWKQREFSELLDEEDGIRRGPFGSALKKEFFVTSSDYVVYEQQNAIYDRYNTRYNISKEKFEELHRFTLQPNDFILSGAGTIGRISKVPEGIRQGVFNQALIRIKINDEVTDSNFFLQWMRSDDMQKKLTYANPASAMVNLVPMQEVKKWSVIVPDKEEQSKLGDFFNRIDQTIAFQQRKLEKMKLMKSAYLSEMFPAEGEFKPKRRFPGFTDAWEQRELGEVIENVTDYVAAGSFASLRENVVYKSYPDYAQLVRTADLKSDFNNASPVYVDKRAFDFLYRVDLSKESIVLPNIGNCGEVYYISPDQLPYERNVLGPNAILVRSDSSSNKFLSILFQGENFQEKLKLIVSPNGQTKFNKTELKQIQLIFPNDINEQNQIGQFFSNLDQTIAFQQQKLEKLQNIKKAYLNEMFI